MMSSDSKTCFHCGLPVPDSVDLPITYQQTQHPTCCAGCQAVAQGIIDAGLGNYYAHRTADAQQASLPPDEILQQLKLYDLPEMQAEFVEQLSGSLKEAMLMLSGITCSACVWLIEQQLLRTMGVKKVELNYSTQRARVLWDDAQIQLSDILLIIQKTGYSAAPYDAQKYEVQAQQERKKMIIRMLVAGLGSMQTMMFALPTYLYDNIEAEFLTILHWASFFAVLPAILYAAQPFFKGAWRDFKNKRTGMDTPIAIAILLTFIAGIYAMFTQESSGMYFESIAMLVFFLLIGRFMEQNAQRKAGDAAERLVKLVPAFCHRYFPDEDRSEEAAVTTLKTDDVIIVRAGEIIPVDGVILRGESEVNESMLTGESLPIYKVSGSLVVAGTLNINSPLVIRATQVGQQTRLAHIVKLLDRAMAQKPHLAQLADRYASRFTFSMIVMAIPTFALWWWLADVHRALWITVSLLVITCPCALSLATPTALAASMGKLASHGILTARGHVLENLAHITDAVFDKTGTLTQGQLSVTTMHNFSGSLNDNLAIAKLLEQHSEHPIAQAILQYEHDFRLPENISVAQQLNKVGHGISANITLNGVAQIWSIGKPDFVAQIAGQMPESLHALMQQGSVVALGNQNGFQAAFLLRDTVRHDAAAIVQHLHAQNIAVHVLSGDNEAAVNQLADELSIVHRASGALPEEKLAYVQKLQQQNQRVLMLGDGINDAPVLAAADISVAVANSADVARDGADVLLLNDDLHALPIMLAQAKKTRQIIRQNLTWASIYNLVVIPMAVAGWVTPWIAAIGMSASSLLVVGNALRLRK